MHPDHVLPEDMKSSDLSRYPPPMMLGLAGAISKKLQDIGKISSRPTISWNTMASTDPHVVHRDPVSDRPSSLPLAHRISLMRTWWYNWDSELDLCEMEVANHLRGGYHHH